MKPEIFWLAITAMMTGLFFIPYVLDRMAVRGIWGTLKNPGADDKSLHDWAQRAQQAHYNAVENLVYLPRWWRLPSLPVSAMNSRCWVAFCISGHAWRTTSSTHSAFPGCAP